MLLSDCASATHMGRRGHQRLEIALPVTITGLDTNGNPFKQTATTVDIGPKGMRIRGIYCLRGRGDLVRVEYKNTRADFRVAWIGETEGLVGLEGMMEDAQFLFARHLPPETSYAPDPRLDTFVPPDENSLVSMEPAPVPVASIPLEAPSPERGLPERQQKERRRHPRFPCAGTARIFESGIEQPTTHRINEISLGGCYIEMMSPLPVGWFIVLELELNGRTIRIDGMVRSSQLAYGMGVQFTAIAPAEQEKLAEVIAEVSGQVAPRPLKPSVPAPAPVAVPAAAAAPPPMEEVPAKDISAAVQRWFGIHDSLSRADFLKLVEELKSLVR